MAIQKRYHMQQMAIYIKYSQKGLSTSPTQTTDAISLSCKATGPLWTSTVLAATTSASTRSWWSSHSHRWNNESTVSVV
jgi:hypothetical protein